MTGWWHDSSWRPSWVSWTSLPSAARRSNIRSFSIPPVCRAGLSVSDVESALAANNGNAGGGFNSEGGQFYYIRGLGRIATLDDIGNTVLASRNGTPILVKDVGDVVVGHAPRLGHPIQRTERRRRRRDPDAPGRADPDRPERCRGEDRGAQQVDPPQGRQSPALLRPLRSGGPDHAHR